MTKDDKIIYNAPRDAHIFTIDNQKVHRTLDEMATGKDSIDWIRNQSTQRNFTQDMDFTVLTLLCISRR